MTNRKYSTEVHRRVYDDNNGQYLTVRPDSDGSDLVELSVDKTQEEYWGPGRFVMEPEMARLLGHALIQSAQEMEMARAKG